MKKNLCRSFSPSASPGAKILILGSMPGIESLRRQEYYAFRHNAFWRIMGEIFSFDPEAAYPERLSILRSCGIALWDTLACCEREGSLDSVIREPVPNDIAGFLKQYPAIRKILCNGSAAWTFLKKYHPDVYRSCVCVKMPSTSPAAAMIPYAEKLSAYRKEIMEILA